MAPEDVATLGGYRVTAPARTIVDLAKRLSFEAAVVAADWALNAGITTVAALTAAADRQSHYPGIRRAHRVIAFADRRSESVGESRTRVMIHRAALPRPQLQYEVRSRAGILLGRADFGWAELRTLGEFDGREKYGRRLRPGQLPGDAVFQEKLREDAMRDLGWQFVRLTWADLDHPAEAVTRIRRALQRGGRSHGG